MYQNICGCNEQAVRTLKILQFLDFTVKRTLAFGCQFTCRYFYGHLLVEDFSKSRYGRVMLTDGTRKYLCRKAIWPKTIHVLSYCVWFLKMFTGACKNNGKWTSSLLLAKIRKIYGYSLQCTLRLHRNVLIKYYNFKDVFITIYVKMSKG